MHTSINGRPDPASETEPAIMQQFWRYEAALMANDVSELDDLFWNDEQTIRADHTAVLLGHNAIAEFRASRSQGAPPRTITDVHVREVSDDAAVVLAENCRPDGTRGLQTQIWRRTPAGWKVVYAHLSAGSPRDTTVWRKVGAPLLEATRAGTLSGLSVAVKDLFAVAGERVGAGTPTYLDAAPTETDHAWAVATLVDNGATVTGIAHTDELAYSLGGTNPHYGAPPNPAAPERIPGGSTSGPATAVTSGEVDLGLGTDTAGSIRVPASYQGLWGFRPTHGRIDTTGLVPLAPSFDTVGLLARDIVTLRLGADALLAGDSSRPAGSTDEVTEIVVDPTVLAYAEPEVAQSFWRAVRSLAHSVPLRCHDVTDGRLSDWFAAFRTLQAYEAWQTHGEFLTAHPEAVTTDVSARFHGASQVSAGDADAGRTAIIKARAHLDEMLGSGSVLLLPSTSGPAPLRSIGSAERARIATLHLTCLASLSGRPAISAPCLAAENAPVGLSAVGAVSSDDALLRFAQRHLSFRA